MDVPLPWERVLWRCRSLLRPRQRYVLTDFRLVSVHPHRVDEVVLRDVADVQRSRSWIDRLVSTSTVVVHSQNARCPPLLLRHVRRGEQLAALLDLLAGDPRIVVDPDSVRAALSWKPRAVAIGYAEPLLSLAVMIVAVFGVAIGLHGKTAGISYPPDDAIAPGGVKRDRAAIVGFMESEVLPWARKALGPLKGGAANITCETCHGRNPQARDWQMPAVAALPQQRVATRGWEVYSSGMDAQMRNAIYGYIAESDNQAKAAYMREVVMPGMARLLHRVPYDFTRPYDYNRTRVAFGCYHCHRVK